MHLGIIGNGNIGQALIQRVSSDTVSEITVLNRRRAGTYDGTRFVQHIKDLIAAKPSLVVECAGHAAARASLIPLLDAGIPIIPASLGVFSDQEFFDATRAATKNNGSEIIFPSGAIGGLDVLRAVSVAGDVRVTYRGVKPPAAWMGSPAEDLVDLDTLSDRAVFFSGSAREAASAFPKNANVVAALALAGPGFDTVGVELIADPKARGNTHSYDVTSPVCRYQMSIENAASSGNARTSETTILSLLQEVQAFAKRSHRVQH